MISSPLGRSFGDRASLASIAAREKTLGAAAMDLQRLRAYNHIMQKDSKAARKKAAPSKTPARNRKAPAVNKSARAKTKSVAPGEHPRRAIFIDVENTSGEAALLGALDQLGIDRTTMPTELIAVGNWRVIGQHVARMLAQRGARLLHTAPATGVKDWSDLSIAVAAGIWLGRAKPGDHIDIVSADRAFDAVADAAINLGVNFRRLTYGPLSGLAEAITPAAAAEGGARRGRRGGRRRRGTVPPPASWGQPPVSSVETPTRVARPVQPTAAPAVTATEGIEKDIHGATPEQIIATIARLTAKAPERGVNLDLLINALKAEGFGRPPGSPRLVTRLRKMKDVEVSPTGMVRLVSLPPGPLPMELPVEPPGEPSAASASDGTPAEKPVPGKRPRRRGGRGRRRPKAAPQSTREPAASEVPV